MPVLGINANYLTGTMFSVEDYHRYVSQRHILKKEKTNAKQADMPLLVSENESG